MFDERIFRLGTNSIKWDRYNNEEIIAMGTADMDFMSPQCVTEALINRAKLGMFAYELKSDSYYNAIIDWYAQRYNWRIKKNGCLIRQVFGQELEYALIHLQSLEIR